MSSLTESVSIFEQLFEAAPDAVLTVDSEGRITRLNAQAERMFGCSRQELLGQAVEVLIPERFRQPHHAYRQRYGREPRLRQMGEGLQLHARRKDGSEFPVDIMLSPLDTGEGLTVLAVIRDITERQHAEAMLLKSQTMFERLFESSPDAIVATDRRGHIARVNAQTENIFGYSREELVGQPVEILMPERFRHSHMAERQDYYTAPRLRPMGAKTGLHAKRKDGSEFPVDIALSPIEMEDGSLVLSVIRDVTERQRAEEALRESEERFRLLVLGVKDYAIFMLDPTGHVVSWNEGAERIKGYKAEEILGRHFSCFYSPEDRERHHPEEELELAAALGRHETEGWRFRKDGSRFWANTVVTALTGPSGELRGFAKVTRDITERKRAEEALLLEITNVLVSNLDIRRLLSAISAGVRQVAPHDYASLSLYDPETRQLRLQVLDSPFGKDLGESETVIPLEGSPAGFAFSTRQPLVLDQIEEGRFEPDLIQHLLDAGVKSGCWLPLISHGRVLGTLNVGSFKEGAFKERQLNLLGQMANQVAIAIDNAQAFRQIAELKDRLAEEKLYLEDELRTEYNFDEIVGESAALKRVLNQVETVAPTDATVLILGETGTGKELIARAIHNLSPRGKHTFVKLNCAAIPGGLLESELFGHERGSFTGAIAQKVGRVELAHEGTLFLDEVGDIPLELQPKLLRALQEKEIERLGSTRTIPVDLRLVAATNQDLGRMVQEHRFRSDLYYRLKVFPITVPPLRERREDIPVLVHYFAQRHAQRMNKQIESIPPDALEALARWSWPGNVRELENFIERAVILTRGPVLRVPLTELRLPAETGETDAAVVAAPGVACHETAATLEAAEREHILRVLEETKGVIGGPKGAATLLGLKRTTLNSKLRKLGITREDF